MALIKLVNFLWSFHVYVKSTSILNFLCNFPAVRSGLGCFRVHVYFIFLLIAFWSFTFFAANYMAILQGHV